MWDLLVGGAIGLMVAVVTQLMARGGRLKGLRSTIREEFELTRLLELNDDPLRVRLRLQARVHLMEYLNDPELDHVAGKLRSGLFGVIWGILSVSVLITMVAFDIPFTGGEVSPRAVGLGLLVGVVGGCLAMVASHMLAKWWVRGRYSAGVLRMSQEELRRLRATAADETS